MGKQKKRDNTGRAAIEWIKDEYLNGRSFASRYDIHDALVTASPLFLKCSPGQVTGWDLQARLELADTLRHVTQPVGKTGQARLPLAGVDVRGLTQRVRLRELAKRTRNQARIANAVAAQGNATPSEIRQATELKIALRILEDSLIGQ